LQAVVGLLSGDFRISGEPSEGLEATPSVLLLEGFSWAAEALALS
jgi:hypothetical protein